jgi:hypothetical protein
MGALPQDWPSTCTVHQGPSASADRSTVRSAVRSCHLPGRLAIRRRSVDSDIRPDASGQRFSDVIFPKDVQSDNSVEDTKESLIKFEEKKSLLSDE